MSSKIKILSAALAELAVINAAGSASRTERINSDNTLSFSLPLKKAAAACITDDSVYELNGDYFETAYMKKEQQSDGRTLATVEAEHISYRLNNKEYNVDYFTMTGTPAEILTAILAGTGFTSGTVSFTASVTFSLQEATSRRALLVQFAVYLGGELSFAGFEVSILTQRGSATPKPLTVGKDVTIMSRIVDKRNRDADGNPTIAYTCGVYKGTEIALGDVVALDYDRLGVDVTLRVVGKTYDPYNPNNVAIEVGNYVSGMEDALYRIATTTVTKDKIYNGCRIGPEYGFEAVRSDNKARSFFRSDGLAIQTGDGGGTTWTNKLWVEIDGTGAAQLMFDGTLSADVISALSAVITPNLYAEKATIAELTVDRLDTSTKVAKYLASDTSDVNYIRAEGQTIQFVTSSTDGATTEQATDRNSAPLYWVDETHKASTTDNTGLPVTVYVYTEAVKAELSFYDDSGTYIPRIVMGAGTGTGDNDKLIIYKPQDAAIVQYVTDAGTEMTLKLSAEGIECIGNTGAKGIRNIAVSSTEPTEPQTNDLWIDTGA